VASASCLLFETQVACRAFSLAREQNGGKNCDDGDYHEQLDEREARAPVATNHMNPPSHKMKQVGLTANFGGCELRRSQVDCIAIPPSDTSRKLLFSKIAFLKI
jgi:hypothetical protein